MEAKEKLAQFFETDYPLNQEGVEELIAHFELVNIPKNRVILQSDSIEKKLRFLSSGIVREYYLTEDKEVNINFYTNPQFITDFTSFINQIPTRKHQESLSDIKMLEIGINAFTRLLEKYKCGKSFIDQTFQTILKQKEAFEYNRITKDPEVLYRELQLYKPMWLQNIPQYHIASYLGITPETLSRIRKRIS